MAPACVLLGDPTPDLGLDAPAELSGQGHPHFFQRRKAETQNQGLAPGNPKRRASSQAAAGPQDACPRSLPLSLSGRAQLPPTPPGPSPGIPPKKACTGPSSPRASPSIPSPRQRAGQPGRRPPALQKRLRGDKGGARGGGCPLPAALCLPPAPRVRARRLGGAARRLPPPILVLIGCQAEISEKEIHPGSG